MSTQGHETGRSAGSRRGGYAAAVVVNALILYGLNVEPGWQAVPFLTDGFSAVLALVNLSIVANLLVNLVQIAFDPPWLVATGRLLLATISLVVSLQLLAVFPFDFAAQGVDWATVTRILLWIGVSGSVVGMLVAVVQIVRAVAIATTPHGGAPHPH